MTGFLSGSDDELSVRPNSYSCFAVKPVVGKERAALSEKYYESVAGMETCLRTAVHSATSRVLRTQLSASGKTTMKGT